MARQTLVVLGLLVFTLLVGLSILAIEPGQNMGLGETAAEEAEEEYERGPNGGRLLRNGDFALEVTIYESGVPPEFRLYPYLTDEPIDPSQVEATITLSRLGGVEDQHRFSPVDDSLVGSLVVYEPHSFEVSVSARYNGRNFDWSYESLEGRTTIPDAVAAASGVETELVGPATIRELVHLTGVVRIDPKRIANIKPRFPGVVQNISANIGQFVERGTRLAVIESNESLRAYEITAPISGTVINRSVGIGEFTSSESLFQIADLSSVIAELKVFPSQLEAIGTGQPALISAAAGNVAGEGMISLLAPTVDANTQSVGAWVELENEDMSWRPGMMIRGDVTVGSRDVDLAVKNDGLQRFRDFTVVYAKVDETYEVRMLDLGLTDGTWTEVLGGITSSQEYVSANSFLIKADIEKDGASHDH